MTMLETPDEFKRYLSQRADGSDRLKWLHKFIFADKVGQMKPVSKCHEADASLKYASPILCY